MVVSIADVMACTNGQSSKVSSLLAIVIVVMVRGRGAILNLSSRQNTCECPSVVRTAEYGIYDGQAI